MDHLVAEMVTHYHEERPHQSKENAPLVAPTANRRPADRTKVSRADASESVAGEIKCRERLGGRLKHYYYRHAA